MYCEKCRILFEEKRCPRCGNRRVREVLPEDFCFLTEKEMLWEEMIEDALTQNQIPFLQKGKLGAGVTLIIGTMAESIRYYVPYARLEEARTLIDELFPSDEETEKTEEEAEEEDNV